MSESSPTLTIATYNIEMARDRTAIIENIEQLALQGVHVFCLQEVIYAKQNFFLEHAAERLGSHWKYVYFIGEQEHHTSMGTAILWDTRVLQLISSHNILLPQLKGLMPHETFFVHMIGFHKRSFVRRSIQAVFSFHNTTVRISSFHADVLGGVAHRMKQIAFFFNLSEKYEYVPHEIICGDFNTVDIARSGKEKEHIEKIAEKYGFFNATGHVRWTQDIYYGNFVRDGIFVQRIIKFFHIHAKHKLDYIWYKGFDVLSAERKDLFGSDHFPIIATLKKRTK